jgi:hypothetical protein
MTRQFGGAKMARKRQANSVASWLQTTVLEALRPIGAATAAARKRREKGEVVAGG